MTKRQFLDEALKLALDYRTASSTWPEHPKESCATVAFNALEQHLTEQLDELLLAAYADGRQDALREVGVDHGQ